MLVRPHEWFERSRRGGFALAAFPGFTLEALQAIFDGAERAGAPVIVQITEDMMVSIGLRTLTSLIRALAADSEVPAVLHLDHGKRFEVIQAAIEAGCTSVMVDAAAEDLTENIRLTREVVEYAHDRGVWVEGGLGSDQEVTAAPDARRYAEASGLDSLAVSVGTIHGAFSGREYIRFELLAAIEKELPHFPLVLHGASGVSDSHLRQVVRTNVCKVNVSTELYQAFVQAVYSHMQTKPVTFQTLLPAVREAMAQVVQAKIALLGGSGQGTLEPI